MVRWLLAELPVMVAGGLLDEDGARRLREHYEPLARSDDRRRTSVVLSVLGALLTGAGIALLVAHNWDSLAQGLRVGIAMAILLSGQAVAGFALWRRRASTEWTEGASLYLAATVATSIALIHQIYQVAIRPDSYFLWCTALVLPVVYLLRSRAALAAVWIGATSYLVSRDWIDLRADQLAWYVALLVATLPFAIRLYREHADEMRTALFGWVAAPSLAIVFARLAVGTGHRLWLPLLAGLGATMVLFGVAWRDEEKAGLWRHPWQVVGAFGLGLLTVVFGFREVWHHQAALGPIGDTLTLAVVSIAAAMLIVCAGGAWWLIQERAYHYALLVATPVPVAVLWLAGRGETWSTVGAVTISLYGFATGLVACLIGLRRDRLGTANAGLLLMVAILSMRFVDADWSFLARGVGFIALGLGFLMVNGWMLRRRAEARA
jgi:uncharacterized membrane protein